METHFQYRGDLSETALPDTLFTIYRFRVPGVMEARDGEIVKRIYIKDGHVIFARSNDRNDSLGVFLHRSGKINTDEFAATMKARANSERRHGELMIEEGLLTPAEMYEALREQIEAVVWSLFEWERGEVAFQIGEFDDAQLFRIHLPVRQVILRGVKRIADAKRLVARLGRRETVFEPSFTTEDLVEIGLDGDEYRLLNLVDGSRSLYDVCRLGPRSAAENAKLMYAFQALRLIRRSEKQPKKGGVKVKLRGAADRSVP